MSDAQSEEAYPLQPAYDLAVEQFANGASRADVQAALVEAGYDRGVADQIVEELSEIRRLALRSTGIRNIVVGSLWFVGGIAVTVATLNAAKNGGTYVVAWGAVLFGGIQMLHGGFQFLRAMFR